MSCLLTRPLTYRSGASSRTWSHTRWWASIQRCPQEGRVGGHSLLCSQETAWPVSRPISQYLTQKTPRVHVKTKVYPGLPHAFHLFPDLEATPIYFNTIVDWVNILDKDPNKIMNEIWHPSITYTSTRFDMKYQSALADLEIRMLVCISQLQICRSTWFYISTALNTINQLLLDWRLVLNHHHHTRKFRGPIIIRGPDLMTLETTVKRPECWFRKSYL